MPRRRRPRKEQPDGAGHTLAGRTAARAEPHRSPPSKTTACLTTRMSQVPWLQGHCDVTAVSVLSDLPNSSHKVDNRRGIPRAARYGPAPDPHRAPPLQRCTGQKHEHLHHRGPCVELQPHSSTQWIATYYPLVETTAGRWAEVTWMLHQRLMPIAPDSRQPARWLDARSPDPGHPCYANHQGGDGPLAAGYAAALAVYDAEAIEELSTLQDPRQLRDATVLIPAGQLSEWVLDDVEDETTEVRG